MIAPGRRGRCLRARAAPCTMVVVNWVVLIAGVVGLAVAAYGLVAVTTQAVRRRRYADVVLAVALAVVTVSLLVAFGDRIIR